MSGKPLSHTSKACYDYPSSVSIFILLLFENMLRDHYFVINCTYWPVNILTTITTCLWISHNLWLSSCVTSTAVVLVWKYIVHFFQKYEWRAWQAQLLAWHSSYSSSLCDCACVYVCVCACCLPFTCFYMNQCLMTVELKIRWLFGAISLLILFRLFWI